MKKTLSLVLALSLCLSLALIFSACGHEHEWAADWSKDETHHWHVCKGCTEVADKAEHSFGADNTCVCGATRAVVTTIDSDTAWVAAFELGTNWQISATAYAGETVTQSVLTERNGNKLKNAMTQGGRTVCDYEALEDGAGYTYESQYDNGTLLGYRLIGSYLSDVEFVARWNTRYFNVNIFGSFSDYTYNAAAKRYEAASLADGMVTDAWLSFADGKVIAGGYSMTSGTQTMSAVITISYGTAGEITLPTNILS